MDSWEQERDEYAAKQEAQKAAELKARLDKVEERAVPTYGRLPRKVGEIVVDTGLPYPANRATFVLRLDAHKGEFIAQHGDVMYVSESREALKAKMEQVGRAHLSLKWTRYLEVSYEAVVERESDRYYGRYTEKSQADKRGKKHRAYGIKLTWEVVEYSDRFQIPGGESRHMKRDVDKNGKPSEDQESVDELPDVGLIEYTPAREALLEQVVDAMTAIDVKLADLLRGDSDDVAKRIDTLRGIPQLLAGGDR